MYTTMRPTQTLPLCLVGFVLVVSVIVVVPATAQTQNGVKMDVKIIPRTNTNIQNAPPSPPRTLTKPKLPETGPLKSTVPSHSPPLIDNNGDVSRSFGFGLAERVEKMPRSATPLVLHVACCVLYAVFLNNTVTVVCLCLCDRSVLEKMQM